MRTLFFLIAASLTISIHAASFEPELGSIETMETPGDHWFMTVGFSRGGNIFDADTGCLLYTSPSPRDRG